MKKYLFIVLLVGVWSCEDKREEDTTPPSVTITSPQNNSEVSEIVSITCMASDNEGIERVELWVNGASTGLVDQTEPYSFDWNSTSYSNESFTIIIRAYDINGNTTDSSPLILRLNNTFQGVTITSVNYNTERLLIEWTPSLINHFNGYFILRSDYEDGPA